MDSKEVKKFCKQFDKNVRVRSINGTRRGEKVTWYIEAWGNFEGHTTLRTLALRVIFGENFDIGQRAIAGNIQTNSLTMSPQQWQSLIAWWTRLTTSEVGVV